MEISLKKIGNSKGVIIPSRFLKSLGISNKIKMDIFEDKIVIMPPDEAKARKGWEKILKNEMRKGGQPEKLIPDIFEDEIHSEWTW